MTERASPGRRLRRGVGAVLATLLILAATAMALGQLLLPLALRHPDRVADLLAARLGRPVAIDTLSGEWQPSGPLFAVDGLRVGSGDQALLLPHAQLKVDFGAWLSPLRRWLELRLDGVHLRLSRDAKGGWHVAGLGPMREQGAAFDGRLPVDLSLSDLRLDIDDARSGRRLQLHAMRLRAIGRSGSLRVGGLLDGAGAAPVRVVADIDPRRGDARAYLAGQHLDLPAWVALLGIDAWHVESGTADVRAWLSWRDGALLEASANLRLGDLALDHGARHLDMPAWNGWLRLARAAPGWQIGYRATTQPDEAASAWFARDTDGGLRLALDADALDLSALLPWLQLLPQVPTGVADWLRAAAPHGHLRDLHLAWAGATRYRLRADLDGLGFAAAAGVPGVDAVDGTLQGDGGALSLQLPPQALTVSVPGVFRKPFAFSRVTGTLALWRAATGWRIGSDGFEFDGEGYAGSLRGQCTFPAAGGAPVLDVAAVADHGEVPAAKLFWPVNVMPASAREWLDRALVSGRVSGRASFRGPLDDFPFADRRGRFEAVADFDDVLLDFHPEWPKAEGLHGRVRFVDNGMDASVDRGGSLGIPADRADARIADFHHPELELSASTHGDAGRMLRYLRRTPVAQGFADALDSLEARGPTRADFNLDLPLHDEPGRQPQLNGHATLAGVDFGVPGWGLQLGKLGGRLHFSADGLDGDGIDGRYRDKPVKLGIRVGSAATDPLHELEARMRGGLDVATLASSWPELATLADVAQGSADFDVALDIDHATGDGTSARRLRIASDLAGIALRLPAPLDKPAASTLPLRIEAGLPFAGNRLELALGDLLHARLDLAGADRPLAADIALGGSAEDPPPGKLRVHGNSERLDIAGWLSRAFSGAAVDAPALAGLDLATPHALLGQRDLGALHLQLLPLDDGFRLDLDGAAVAGNVELPRAQLARRGITARLDRLYWPEGEDDAPAAATGVSPAALPPLHLWVRDLRLGQARLGEVHFESVPMDGGMQVEQLDAQSKEVQISARGRWSGDAGASATHMAIDFSSGDLGRMLDAFGYSGLVAGGTTLAHIDGSWPGPPSAFSLAGMDGSMKAHVEDGRILDVDPGVGRLFGLFSIRELPRRLSLDFGDIFESGFAFNSIDGHFAFADGNARTRDLVIRGPSAVIEVSGRTGLKAKDYDQDIVVTPHVGVALPVVGALAGGPVGAAAGLAVQGLLGKGLNRAAAVHYRVTGGWENPDIKLVPDDGPRPPRRANAAKSPAPAATAPAPAATVPAVETPAGTRS